MHLSLHRRRRRYHLRQSQLLNNYCLTVWVAVPSEVAWTVVNIRVDVS